MIRFLLSIRGGLFVSSDSRSALHCSILLFTALAAGTSACRANFDAATPTDPNQDSPDTENLFDNEQCSDPVNCPDGEPETEEVATGSIPVFMAQGDLGTTVLSCDGGASWVNERSARAECEEAGDADCSPSRFEAGGIAWDPNSGVLALSWGVSTQGRVERSTDGLHWTEVVSGGTFQDVAFGNEVFLAFGETPLRFDHEGVLLPAPTGRVFSNFTVRGFGHSSAQGGFFYAGGYQDVSTGGSMQQTVRASAVSTNAGRTWRIVRFNGTPCGGYTSGIATDGRVTMVADYGSSVFCTSEDRGLTWSNRSLIGVVFDEGMRGVEDVGRVEAGPVVSNGKFMLWADVRTRTSTDLESRVWMMESGTWTSHATSPSGMTPRVVAVNPEGRLVAWKAGFFYYSENGIDWTQANETPTRPIEHIEFARLPTHQELCPTR